jgi:hypothetical protein
MEPVRRTEEEVRTAITSFRDGRDEMNLVEFPIATLSERAPKGVNTLEFEDEIFDPNTKRQIKRRLTVAATEKHGLPTAKDEEVYLGLLQLTKLYNEFTSPEVTFTRHQLIKLLGWDNTKWSYDRIATAMDRLGGVRLYYQNAWRDNSRKEWRDRGNFGIIDYCEFRDARVRASDGDSGYVEQRSRFRWNSALFESFQSGYLKKLDYRVVLELDTLSRRLYRYLDKHFNPPRRMEIDFDLRVLAFEHLGMSRNYDAAQMKRKLRPATKKLEELGFLETLTDLERYTRIARGNWRVVFRRSPDTSELDAAKSEATGVLKELLGRGVSRRVADELCSDSDIPAERVEQMIELFDWHNEQGRKKEAGFLVQAIRENYSFPNGFSPKRRKARTARPVREAPSAAANKRQADDDQMARRIDAYLAKLSEDDRRQLEERALRGTSPTLIDQLQTEQARAEMAKFAVRRHVRDLLLERDAA